MIVEFTSFVFLLLYCFLIVFFIFGFLKLKIFSNQNHIDPNTFVSIVIPARNESKSIVACIESLMAQNYSRAWFEVIVIDDHSTDDTPLLLNKLKSSSGSMNLHNLSMSINTVSSKKNALDFGISKANGTIIITLDADCVVGENWLSNIVSYYQSFAPKMMVLPIFLNSNSLIFSKLQSLEFMSLIAASAGSLGQHKPLMCNGAGLVFERSAFEKVGGYQSNLHIPSGDDIFLMHEIKREYGSHSIHFIKNPDVLVRTHASSTFKEFISQRLRWTSKSKHYRDPWIIFVAIIVLLTNLGILYSLLRICTGHVEIKFVAVFLALKAAVDFILLYVFASFYQAKKQLWYFFPVFLLLPIYTVLIGILGNVLSFSWKGRRVPTF